MLIADRGVAHCTSVLPVTYVVFLVGPIAVLFKEVLYRFFSIKTKPLSVASVTS